jgi:alkylation response protein AidB-like acyl-CoA dehydrogenase
MLKIFQTELFQRVSETGLALAGELGATLEPMDGNRSLNPQALFLQSRPASIYSGTNEIQRNVVAKNVLRLPT